MISKLSPYFIVIFAITLVSCTRVHPNNSSQYASDLATRVFSPGWIYMEELYHDGFEVLNVEESIDERVSNTLLTHAKVHPMDINLNKLSSTNPHVIDEYNQYVNGPEVNDELCSAHLYQMVRLLEEMKQINDIKRSRGRLDAASPTLDKRHIRLARVLDSYGKNPSGLLDGQSFSFGSSAECLDTKLQLNTSDLNQLTGTRSCIATLDPYSHLHLSLKKAQHDPDHEFMGIQVHICLPNTCHSNSLANNRQLIQTLIDSQFILPASIYVNQSREVVDLFCLNDGNQSTGIPTDGKILLYLITAWIFVIVLVTVRNNVAPILRYYFDLGILIENFVPFRTSRSARRLNLDSLDFIKAVLSMLVIFGHCSMIVLYAATDRGRAARERDRSIKDVSELALPMIVDSFFVMSGMIWTYLGLKRLSNTRFALDEKFNLSAYVKLSLGMVLNRYLRIVPLFWLYHRFKKSVFLYIGHGPQWNHGFNSKVISGGCKEESWFSVLTPLASYGATQHSCLPTAWSTHCEIAFAIVLGPLIVLMKRKPRLVITLALLMSAIGSSMMFNHLAQGAKVDRIRAYTYIRYLRFLYGAYVLAHFRISSPLLGLIGGYMLYQYDLGYYKEWPNWLKKLPKTAAVIANSVLASLIILCLYRSAVHSIPFWTEFIRIALPHSQVTLRAVWVAINISLMLRIITDWNTESLAKFFRWQLWKPLSRLSFAMHLVGFDVMLMLMHVSVSLHTSDRSQFWIRFGATLSYTMILSTFVHVIFEIPLNKMAKDLLRLVFGGTNEVRIAKVEAVNKKSEKTD